MQKQNDLTRSDFSSLDIFLFSNGQEDSPPRKYNLRADELNWWDATLTHLARSHYGSKHSGIELYTVDGRRVAGARELRGDGAYVAVAPPDPFIQSGYDKYLIKASRSWEKRQERKASNDALSLTEKDKYDYEHTNNTSHVKDTTNIKIYQDITIVPTSSTVAEDPAVVKANTDRKAKPNGPKPASGKQMPKRKITSSPQPNPSILRKKYVNPVNPKAKKANMPTKESSKVETVKNKVDSRIIKNSHKEPSLLKVNRPVIAQIVESEIQSPDKIYSINQVIKEEIRENQEPSVVVIETVAENELSQKQDNVDKDTLSKIYHNEEHHQSIFINPNIPVKNNAEMKQKCESLHETSEIEHKVVINSGDTDQKTTFSESYYEVRGNESKTRTRPSDATGIIDKKLIVSGNQTSDSFAIFINQGETVKLKLDIEIKSVPVSIEEHNCKSPDCNSRQSEKGTDGQVAMAEETEPLQRYCGRSGQAVQRCCQNLPQDNTIQETINDLKTIVCQCTCCPNSEKASKAAPVYFDNNNYFILLPSEKINENLLGCTCVDESPSKIEINHVANEQNIIVVAEILKRESLDFAKERLSTLKTGSKTSNCDQSLKRTVLPTSTTGGGQSTVEPTARRVSIENLLATGSAMIGSSSSKLSDVATQTDWARLLLEVRLHEDGHYSFHMPPLEILKIYDMLYDIY